MIQQCVSGKNKQYEKRVGFFFFYSPHSALFSMLPSVLLSLSKYYVRDSH